MRALIQQQDFDLSAELASLRADNTSIGALVSFVFLIALTATAQEVSFFNVQSAPTTSSPA